MEAAKPEGYRGLIAWQRAMVLAEQIYVATREFPGDERFGLTLQLRRAAVSVPSNIAEGYGRGSRKEFTHFLRIARGSLCEAETQLLLAHRLGFLNEATSGVLLQETDRVGCLVHNLIRSLLR